MIRENIQSVSYCGKEPREISFNMIRIEGGTFEMGGSTWTDSGHPTCHWYFNDRDAVVSVNVESYYIADVPVTQALWATVMQDDPSWMYQYSMSDRPVHSVTFHKSLEFIQKLNVLTGKKYRLPTEAEWEYAARERGRNVRFGNGKDIADSREMNFRSEPDKIYYPGLVADWDQGYYGVVTPVKTFAPNALGLYDMSGNVWEWCSDDWGKGKKVARGGSFWNTAWNLGRHRFAPDYRGMYGSPNFWGVVGLRLAL